MYLTFSDTLNKSSEKRRGMSLSQSPRSAVAPAGKVESVGGGAHHTVPTAVGPGIVKPEPRVPQVSGRGSQTNNKSPRGRSPNHSSQSSKSLFSRDKIQRTGEKSAFIGKSKFEAVIKPVVTRPSVIAIGSGSSSFQPVTSKSSSSALSTGSVSAMTSVVTGRPVNSTSAVSDQFKTKALWSVSPTQETVPGNHMSERPRAGEKRLSSESQDELAPKKMKSLNGILGFLLFFFFNTDFDTIIIITRYMFLINISST